MRMTVFTVRLAQVPYPAAALAALAWTTGTDTCAPLLAPALTRHVIPCSGPQACSASSRRLACRSPKMSAGWVKLEQQIRRSISSERTCLTAVPAPVPRPQQSSTAPPPSPGIAPRAPPNGGDPGEHHPRLRQHREAMAMVRAGLGYLAAADPAAMTRPDPGRVTCAPRADTTRSAPPSGPRILAAFTAGRGYAADADYSPTSWLIHRTRITKGAARAYLAWARRVDGHPRVVAALAEGGRADRVDGPHHLRVVRHAPPATAGTAPTRSSSPPPGRRPPAGPGPSWPPRSTPGPCRTPPATTRPASRTARSPSRRPFTAPGSSPATSPPSAPPWSPRCWSRCPRRAAPRTPGPRSSGITTRSRRR